MIIALVFVVAIFLVVCLGVVVQVAVSDFKPAGKNQLSVIDTNMLPATVQQYLDKARNVHNPFLRVIVTGFQSIISAITRNSNSETVLHKAVAKHISGQDDLAYILFPDSRLAYIFSKVTGTGQLMQLRPGNALNRCINIYPNTTLCLHFLYK